MTPTPDEPALDLPGLVRDRAAEGRVKAAATRARKVAEAEIAATDPVARVVLDLPLAHLDRTFDYAVPVAMAEDAVPGARVKVRFGGQDVDGFVVARAAASEHDGRLSPLRRVVSPEPVLSPAVAGLCVRVAERYAGVSADVRRLAIPPRHATAEKAASPSEPALPEVPGAVEAWAAYPAAEAFLGHLRAGSSPRAVWGTGPGEDWPLLLAHLAATALAGGRGSILCLPDHRDVARVDAALTALLGAEHHVTLQAEPGPAQRYRDFLAVSRGTRRIVVGTRSAAFAPVRDLGLVVVWDDGDDLHAEPRAPYPHTREVLLLRAEHEGTAALVGGFTRTVEAEQLAALGLGSRDSPCRERRCGSVPWSGSPGPATTPWRATRSPPRRGSRARSTRPCAGGWSGGRCWCRPPGRGTPSRLACERCRTPARCATCSGPLELTGPTSPPRCRWCATEAPDWSCTECGASGLRAPVLGDARTADEPGPVVPLDHGADVLGRADPVGGRRRFPDRGGDAGRGAGRRGWVRRGRAPRHVVGPRSRQHARGRGGAAPVVQRDRAGPAGRARAGGGRPGAAGAAGTGALGPGGVRDPRGRGPASGPAAARGAGGDADRHAGGDRRPPGAAGAARGRRRARSGPGGRRRGRRGAARHPGAAGAGARAGARAERGAAAPLGTQSSRPCGCRWIRRRSEPSLGWVGGHPTHPPVRRPDPAQARDRGRRVRRRACARLVTDLTDTMLDAPGAGLAAPQIGVGLRVFTWNVDGVVGHLVNPESAALRGHPGRPRGLPVTAGA
nr:peptide deformylase [Nocardioides convexus]